MTTSSTRTRFALVVLGGVLIAGVAAPWLSPYDPAQQLDIVTLKNSPPSIAHPFGTDPFARDLWSRALHGARASLLIGLVGAATSALLAVAFGVGAAAMSPRIGESVMGFVDSLRAIPRKIILLAVLLLLPQPSLLTLALVLGATSWTAMSRVIFAEVRALQAREFVTSARALGVSPLRIFSVHVAPHLGGTLAAASAVLVADLLAVEAGLSFIGLGVRPPTASWGTILQDGVPYLASAWWTAAVPCVLLVTTVLCISRLADALSHHSDPYRAGTSVLSQTRR